LLIFSKNNSAYHALKAQFFHHSVQRIYHAVVHRTPNPPSGKIESRLVEWTDGTMHSTKPPRGQVAITHYEVVESGRKRSLLRLTLETGRKHQIRVHLAGINHPIVGDPVYGPGNDAEKQLMLCATELGFSHPRTGRPMHFRLD